MSMSQEDLPGRVRAVRRQRGWTQRQLAEKAGISPRAYQNFETRNGAPQAENLRAILRAVDLDADVEVATGTRDGWPPETQVFLDVMGAYLDTMSTAARLEAIHDMTRRIISGQRPV